MTSDMLNFALRLNREGLGNVHNRKRCRFLRLQSFSQTSEALGSVF